MKGITNIEIEITTTKPNGTEGTMSTIIVPDFRVPYHSRGILETLARAAALAAPINSTLCRISAELTYDVVDDGEWCSDFNDTYEITPAEYPDLEHMLGADIRELPQHIQLFMLIQNAGGNLELSMAPNDVINEISEGYMFNANEILTNFVSCAAAN